MFSLGNLFFQIKVIDTFKKMCTTFLGTGEPGSETKKEVKFNEPGGICVSADGQQLYVADTNNHVVRIIELESKKVTKVRNHSQQFFDLAAS